ncbi:hypothetical protein BDZ85DRAFT_55742 [Elsinoe ampelina]|uniref:Uncharacterized protein n=1 Tax=Elsinoe ampelina TaxID=302913 RepID=A0A6A6GMI6_9PEZI|nr:hypothetical protein BDZ85DRAFT_55742 [Elsinoe ampelina]
MAILTTLRNLWQRPDRSGAVAAHAQEGNILLRAYTSNLHRYEDFVPDPPKVIMTYRENYEEFVRIRGYPPKKGDSALKSLYRIYEHLILDRNIDLRNELERFWYQRWPVSSIPDPSEMDQERLAMLAVAAGLLSESFNDRINKGLPRHAPSIITDDYIEKWKTEPKVLETLPTWAKDCPALPTTLVIPHWSEHEELITLKSFEDSTASQEARKRNILMEQPHIYFL